MARAALFHLVRSQTARQLKPSSFNLLLPQSGYHCCRPGTHLNPPVTESNLTSFLGISQRRFASQSSRADDDGKISIGPRRGRELADGDDEKDNAVYYYGPISTTIKKVKLLSLSTCCLSISLGPVITFMTAPDMNVILKGAVASSVIFFSATTTGLLHWFASPYIHKLKWVPGSDSFEVEMMSWLATPITRTIKFADIRVPETNRPYVSFKANGVYYFVDAECCQNKALLARLTPQEGPVLKNI